MLDLNEIQGDIVIGLRKHTENFIFFKIVDKFAFKGLLKQHVIGRITSSQLVHQRELIIRRRQKLGYKIRERFPGLNLGFTQVGMTRLVGEGRPRLDAAFEKGADHPDTINALNDPPRSGWLRKFVSDRIDGVFLVTSPDRSLVAFHSSELLSFFGPSIKVVYSEIGNTRPGTEHGHEHFGYRDGISQPAIRGLTRRSTSNPDQGLPGQDLLWPGEFVFGYPGQDPSDPVRQGPPPHMAAPWLRNGSYMVFRRLEQKVPEFRRFVADHAAGLGMEADLLGARMFGRWKSGAPLELRAALRQCGARERCHAQQRLRLWRRPFPAQMSVCGAYSQGLSARRRSGRRSRSAEAPHSTRRHPVRSRGGVG